MSVDPIITGIKLTKYSLDLLENRAMVGKKSDEKLMKASHSRLGPTTVLGHYPYSVFSISICI